MPNCRLKIHHSKGDCIIAKIDGKIIDLEKEPYLSSLNLLLNDGKHELILTKKTKMHSRYWWINIFNLCHSLVLFKRTASGGEAYDEDYASCKFNFYVKNNSDSELEIELIKQKTLLKGWEFSYPKWQIPHNCKIKITEYFDIKMPSYLITRWRLIYGLPTSVLAIIICTFIIWGLINESITETSSAYIAIAIVILYALYVLLRVFMSKTVQENIK